MSSALFVYKSANYRPNCLCGGHFNWLASGRHNITEKKGPTGTQSSQ